MRNRGFEIAKGFENLGINIPKRATTNAAGYDIEAAEDIVLPPFKIGDKPNLIKTAESQLKTVFKTEDNKSTI